MTCIAGFDISTREITCAIIPLDPDALLVDMTAVYFRAEPLLATKDDGVRYLDIRTAVRMILGPSQHDVQLAYVEKPRGPFRNDTLAAVFGAVMASIPPHISRASIDPKAWWQELGMPKTRGREARKRTAIDTATQWCFDQPWPQHSGVVVVDEHRADALLVALAGRQLNNHHFRSAA